MNLKDYPQELRPYVFHGLGLNWTEKDKQATAECPWCGKEGTFSIKVSNGVWKCWKCRKGNTKGGGNARTFLQMLWDKSDESTTDYGQLADDRGLLVETLMQWGVAKSILDGSWLVPGYSMTGRLIQLYRYTQTASRKVLLSTSTFKHGLFGVPLFKKAKNTVFLCEGPWDAMALWEVLSKSREGKEGMALTANSQQSLLVQCNVLAVPGCSCPLDAWKQLFKGKEVWILYDNDHPKNGQLPAGLEGAERAAKLLSSVAASVGYLRWGTEGYNKGLPSGYDVGDWLAERGATV